MNDHESVRVLLALTCSGDLSPEELRRVQAHLAVCETCRRESGEFGVVTEALRAIPTPQPRAELLARVRELAELRLTARDAWAADAKLLGPLVGASWVVAAATWPALRTAMSWLTGGWTMRPEGVGAALAIYSAGGFLLACIAALAVGRRARSMGRTR